LYEVFKGAKQIDNFEDIVRSEPLYDVAGGNLADVAVEQTCTNRFSRSLRIHHLILNSMFSFSELLDLTVWMTSPNQKGVCSGNSPLPGPGTRRKGHLTATGELSRDGIDASSD